MRQNIDVMRGVIATRLQEMHYEWMGWGRDGKGKPVFPKGSKMRRARAKEMAERGAGSPAHIFLGISSGNPHDLWRILDSLELATGGVKSTIIKNRVLQLSNTQVKRLHRRLGLDN